jgi:hypothetical protein
MPESGKRKVSAREFLADIRSGMAELQLRRKYGLSDRSLELVYRKLVAAGALTEEEIVSLGSSRNTADEPAPREPQTFLWQCPACGVTQAEETAECPACGVVVTKFLARREHESQPPTEMTIRTASSPNRRIAIAAAVAACLVIGLGSVFWPKKTTTEVNKTKSVAAPAEARRKSVTQSRPLAGRFYELEYSEKGFPLGLSVSQGFALHLFETPAPSQGFKKFPPESGAKRYYDELSIAGGKYLVITEGSDPPRIYLDANSNGDLTDDPGPFAAEGPRILPNHLTVLLPYKNEKEAVPYRMWLFSSRMGGVRFYPKCHWHRMLDLNGRSYRLVVFDANADGDYSNDPLVIDVDNDGKASAEEKLKPGENLNVDGTEVKLIAIVPSGRRVRLDLRQKAESEGS